MRTRRRIGNGGLVDAELVQGQFTLLFGEICSAYPRVELARKVGRSRQLARAYRSQQRPYYRSSDTNGDGKGRTFLTKEEPFMTSNRPQHIEASSPVPTGSDTEKPRALWSLSEDQSDSAVTKKTALSDLSDNLMEQIIDMRNVEKAWRKVKANKGAPGPDRITLTEFPQSFRAQWPTIRQQLLDGTYDPQPARRKCIPKSDGSERKLGIPNVMERLIQQCILQVLTPIFDPHFSESSFGFRPKRSAHGAIKQVQAHIRSGYRHCVDMDLSKFFDQSC